MTSNYSVTATRTELKQKLTNSKVALFSGLDYCFQISYTILNTKLRRHGIKNTSRDFKHTWRPRLVQTEALFNEDKCLSLQELASVWMIQRLCLAK